MTSGAPGGAKTIGLVVAGGAIAFAAGALAFHLLGRQAPPPPAVPERPAKSSPAPAAPKLDLARPETIVGAYLQPGEPQDAAISLTDGKLTLTTAPTQVYPLEPAGERRYKVGSPMPPGYVLSVRPARADEHHFEILLEKGTSGVVLVPRDARAPAGAAGKAAPLVGTYRSLSGGPALAVAYSGGKLVLVQITRPAIVLTETGMDTFGLGPEAKDGQMRVRREGERVIGLVIERGSERIELVRADAPGGGLSTAELRAKAITALGGEDAIKALGTLTADISVSTEGKGVTAEGKLYWRAPDLIASELASTAKAAKGKEPPRMRLVLRGGDGMAASGGQTPTRLTREAVGMLRAQSPVLLELDWPARYASITVKHTHKSGVDELIAVDKTTTEGVRLTDHYDAKSFLLRRRDVVERAPGSPQASTVSTTYEDYRPVGGVMVPMLRTTTVAGALAQQLRLLDVRAGADIPDATFELK